MKDKHKVSITALAIITGGSKSFRPQPYLEEYLGTRITYGYNIYRIIDQSEAELRANPNPFAVVVLVALLAIKRSGVDDFVLKEIKKDLIRELIKRKVNQQKRKGIINFIKYYSNFENPEMMVIFEKESDELLGTSTTMGTEEYLLQKRENEGIQKGLAKGRKEGALEIARNLKKEGLSLDFIAKTTKLSIQNIQAL